MKEITQRFHDLHEERRTFQLRDGVTANQPQEYDEDWLKTISAISEPVIYGRGQGREKIVEFLLGHASNIEDLSIFPIVGMGGLGKTTLAQQVFNDDRVSKHFDLTIWICVSIEFGIERILQSIIESATGQNPNFSDSEAMRKKVQEVLQSKRYLLVLDDVWNEDQDKWKELNGILQCARGTKGSAVLVTTQLEQVASIMETYPGHHLVELPGEDSWSLFKQMPNDISGANDENSYTGVVDNAIRSASPSIFGDSPVPSFHSRINSLIASPPHNTVTENQPQHDNEWRQTSSVITEPTIYGRDQDRDKIMKFLLGSASNNEDLSIYPIVGMAGLGKTTLAQQVFNADELRNHFDLTIWVRVSDDFNLRRILQSIIECSTGENLKHKTLEAMQKEVQEVLQSKRYLLVLDDVWNEDQEKWKELKGILQCARGTKGSAVLVTTRVKQVASIMETYPAHHLVELTEEVSWSLFKHHAFGPNTEGSAELVPIGKEIVRKCGGSPLAIKTVGGLLHGKRLVQQWENVKESEIWEREESSPTSKENSVVRALTLSYVNLELTSRRCFSFCAIFPKGSEIVKEDLIHLWMANEFIKPEGNLEVEDVGEEVWEKLYRRSFFQEAKADVFGIITSFKMHDLFHNLAQFVMGEECKVSEERELTQLSRRVQHLHLLNSNESVNKAAFKKVESLRTFLGENFSCLPSKSLVALRTSSYQLSTVRNLAHLRYLNLFRSPATSLPNSICGLQKLQILKLEDFKCLHCLPKDLTRLQDLRHLVIKGCYSIVEMPLNIGKLSQLRTLSTFVVGSKPGYGLAELNGLKLGGKLHIRDLENVPSESDAQQANLISKKDLNRLHLSWGESSNSEGSNVNAERVLEALQPPSTLKGFGIRGYQDIQLPSWMRNLLVLKDLVEVIFFGCKNCKELPPLGKLPHLKRLYVEEMNDVKHIDGESYEGADEIAFPSLEKLTVRELPKLERVLRDEGIDMLPRLTELIIVAVPNLKLPRLPSVEHLDASNIKDGASFMEVVVGNLPCLKTLKIISFEKLKVLPDQLSKLGALQGLNIEYCDELESLSEDVLQGLTSLRSLKIIDCLKLKSLSEGVGHLACLERFEVTGCPELVDVPNDMNQLTALREVSIMSSTSLPEGLQHISSLQTLLIKDCTSLPDWLGDMTSLRQLIIWNCPELRSLPSNIQRLTNLTELGIYFCPELRSLPSNIQRLTNLSKLTIEDCPKLEKRCNKETGEDWPYIAHIPQLQVSSDLMKDNFYDKIRETLKMFARLFASRHYRMRYTDRFDYMVDVYWN